jgi:hypothetical protein
MWQSESEFTTFLRNNGFNQIRKIKLGLDDSQTEVLLDEFDNKCVFGLVSDSNQTNIQINLIKKELQKRRGNEEKSWGMIFDFQGQFAYVIEPNTKKMRKFSFTSPSFQLFIETFRYRKEGIAEGIFELFKKEQLLAKFYDEYLKLKEELTEILLSKHPNVELEIIEYSEELFERLMFLKFLDSQDFFNKYGYGESFLNNSFRATGSDNFYTNTLEPLFKALNTPQDRRVSKKFNDLPYLNGNLFVERELEKLLGNQLSINNDFFAKIFYVNEDNLGYFEKYQWVTEDSIEEGIDPEILGYIFEQSIHQKCFGAYYTNANIATLMARESVVGYLYKNCRHDVETLEDFADWLYDESNSNNKSLSGQVVDILRKVKILDLAVGSGSLLLAILKEMVKIFSRFNVLKTLDDHYKEILSLMNNIYGVDIHPKAIEKCKLRLWLYLGEYLVDNSEHDLPALPNIDFRMFCGNSLVGFASSPDLKQYFSDHKQQKLLQWDREYFRPPSPERARVTRDNISQMVEKLIKKSHEKYFHIHFESNRHLFIEEILKGLEKLRKRAKYKPPNLSTGEWEILSSYMESRSWKKAAMKLSRGNDEKYLLKALDYSNWFELFQSIQPFHWYIQVFPFLDKGKFDIVIANPPYLAHESLKSLDPDLLGCYLQKKFNQLLVENTKTYSWQQYRYDLLLPFLERALQLTNENGVICMILADSFCRNKYAKKGRKILLEETSLVSLIHFNKNLKLFKKFEEGTLKPVGVQNFIITLIPSKEKQVNYPRRSIFSDYSLANSRKIPIVNQQELIDHTAFRFDQKNLDVVGIPLKFICYLSYGMILNSHSKKPEYKGLFGKNDLVSRQKDDDHPYKYFENKDMTHLAVFSHKYLEWGTERVPKMVEESRFLELFEGNVAFIPQIVGREGRIKVFVSDSGFRSNHSLFVLKRWADIPDLEKLSKKGKKAIRLELGRIKKDKSLELPVLQQFSQKYTMESIAAVLISSIVKKIVHSRMEHKNQFYPSDWKEIPIPSLTLDEVEKLTSLTKKGHVRRENSPKENLEDILENIDKMVDKAYRRKITTEDLLQKKI